MEENRIAQILTWYGDHAQRFIAQHAVGDLRAVDERAAKLKALGQSKIDDVYVYFLGNAGVGKSTLLNALADPKLNILPHGGAGALTAQATELRYSASPYLLSATSAPIGSRAFSSISRRSTRQTASSRRARRMRGSNCRAAPSPKTTRCSRTQLRRRRRSTERHAIRATCSIDIGPTSS